MELRSLALPASLRHCALPASLPLQLPGLGAQPAPAMPQPPLPPPRGLPPFPPPRPPSEASAPLPDGGDGEAGTPLRVQLEMNELLDAVCDGDLPRLQAALRAHPEQLHEADAENGLQVTGAARKPQTGLLASVPAALGQAGWRRLRVSAHSSHTLRCADPQPANPWAQAMHLAAMLNDPRCLLELLRAGADPFAASSKGDTPLDQAVVREHTECIGMLLYHAPSQQERQRCGGKALTLAAQSGRLGSVGALLESGVTPTPDALFAAAAEGQEACCVALLGAGAADGSAASTGWAPALEAAASGGHLAVLKALLAFGPQPASADDSGSDSGNSSDSDSSSIGAAALAVAVQAAVEAGHPACLAELLACKASPEGAIDAEGFNALHRAAMTGRVACLNALLQAEAALEAPAVDGARCTALQLAAFNGRPAALEALLQAGAEFQAPAAGEVPATPLQLASGAGHLPCVLALLAAGARVDAAKPDDGGTALMLAAESGRAGCVSALLAFGADPCAADSSGCTALHRAAIKGHAAAAAELLQAGAPVDARDRHGCTPLFLAATAGVAAAMPPLLAAGADPGAADRLGNTPLFWAAERGHDDAVRLLLSAGASPTAPCGPNGTTPLHVAAALGHLACLLQLTEAAQREGTRGVDVPDKHGCPPAALAAERRRSECWAALQAAGSTWRLPPGALRSSGGG